jgi:4-amino-4-deoxy-L-arabinose transferase-like glycosyltransferase
MQQTVYSKWVLALIGVFFVLRFFTAAILELGNDEAYYWLYSQQLQWNYFDHPPLVALWVKISTLNGMLNDYEAAIRLGSMISCAFSTWFLFKTVSLISNERAGWFAACLFNASLYAGLVAGLLIMPDSPQIFFWTLCLWQIARLLQDDRNKRAWIFFGISAGLCIMSKVHGLFLPAGFVLFTVIKKRAWLRQPFFYISLLLVLFISSPILLWNLQHDFISFRYQGSRVDVTAQPLVKESFWIESISQVLISNPVNFVLIVLGFGWLFKTKNPHPFLRACNFIALPFICFVVFLSMFRDIWFHWTGPAFVSLLPLAAVRLSAYNEHSRFPGALKWSTGLFLLAMMGWLLVVAFYPGTYGHNKKEMLGKGDVTLDKYGWESSGKYFAAAYNKAIEQKLVGPHTPVVCPTWWGAHIEYYFAREAGAPVIGLGDTIRLGQYSWLNEKRLALADMDTAFLIEPSIEHGKAENFYHHYYHKNELMFTLSVYRNGKAASNFYVSRLTGWKGAIDAEFPSTLLSQNKSNGR